MNPKSPALMAVLAAFSILPATAQVVFSESFEASVVSGFDDNTVPSGGRWVGSTEGFGASNRGLYNETVVWPATPPFITPYGSQAYYLNYSNSALTTAQGVIGALTADIPYKVTFNTAVATGASTGNYRVELVAFAPGDVRNDARSTIGTVLASATGAVTTNDMSATGSLAFTAAAGNAHLGKDLAIRLFKSTGSVLYDNIRLLTGHDFAPSPASGFTMPAGNTVLSWTNMPPKAPSTDVVVDVYFGTNPGSLGLVVNDGLNTSATNVNVPGAGTYYWRVDSYPDGDPNGTPVTGDMFFFVVTDSDGDGMPDAWEQLHTDPSSPTALAPNADDDSDGLSNLQEYIRGTDPNEDDTDGDGLLDGVETATRIWVSTSNTGTLPLVADTDKDGLSDGVETNTGAWVGTTNTGTNPNDADWDKDGLKDGAETNTGTYVDRFNTGSNPYVFDTDNDGAGDWYEACATFTNPSSAAQNSPIAYPLPDPDGSAGVSNKPVKVYIMAGQSNTVGIGQVNGTAPGTLETIAKRENKFPNLVDASNNWIPRNDVLYRGVVSATAKGPLAPGQGASSTQVGPELGFGHIMGWYHDEPVLILKASQGNRSLGWDFLPPGSPRWTSGSNSYAGYGEAPQTSPTGIQTVFGSWYGGKQYDDCFRSAANTVTSPPAWQDGVAYAKDATVVHKGFYWICTTAHTAAPATEPDTGASWSTRWRMYENAYSVLAKFETLFPQWAAQGYEIAGFCWWQGHKDQDGTNNIYATVYQQNLVNLINTLRADFNAPNAPFVVASIGFGGEPLSNKQTDFQQVFNAQMAVQNLPQFAGTVKSVDILKYWREIAESPTAQDFHYNQNAETYMLVGDAMGRAMLEMQDDTAPPAPSPMTFAIAPTAVDATTVGMVATTANDVSGPVEYFFENVTNGNTSGWITSTRWDNTGIAPGSYEYRVKARDSKGNQGAWSTPLLGASPGADTTAPAPAPAFTGPLTVLGENSISMASTAASDINGVQYNFACTVGGGPDSGWQSGPGFTATGLNPGTQYTYVVRAKDSAGNVTGDSAPASATTTAPDTSAPTPSPMGFATPPAAIGTNSITMTATSAADPSGVEYFFEAVGGGTSSGWQDSATYTDSSLAPGTECGYRVRARDKSPAQNTTAWSDVLTATTELPDTTPPALVSFNPVNGASSVPVNSNLVVTFNEEITIGTGLITIKNLTDATQSTIAITDGTQINAAGSVLTINPTASLAYQKSYAIQIAATAVEDLAGNGFAGIENDTTWAFTTAVAPLGPGGALIYEPFGQSAGSISAKAGGTGLSNWAIAGTAPTVATTPTLAHGQLGNSGGQLSLATGGGTGAYVTTATSVLTSAGLLNNGATLWFSYLYSKAAGGGSNERSGFAFGTDNLATSGTSGAFMTNSGNGVGIYSRDKGIQPITWNGGGSGVAATGTSFANYGDTVLVVGRVVWGATNGDVETLTIWTPDETNLPANVAALGSGWSKTMTGVDQSLFDTISVQQRQSGGTQIYDEIRFASSYEAVIGQGGAGPGPVESFVISPIASPQTVGTPITGITITAKDASNQTATGFTGMVTFGGTGGFSGTSGTFTAGVLTGVGVTPTVAGTNLTLTVSGSGKTGSTIIATIQTPYAAWSGGVPFDGDANNDGVDNGVAWVLGAANPDANAIALLPTLDHSDPAYVVFHYRRSNLAAAAPGITISARYGGNLGNWTTAVHDGENVIITPAINGAGPGIDLVEVKIKRTLAPLGRLFIQLQVGNNG